MGSKPRDQLLDSAATVATGDDSAPPAESQGLPSTYTAGQLVGGKYRLLRPLGEGGMASVWLAHNEALDIEVAIKFIRAELQAHGLGNRLLQEARAAARLGHPAIVRVTDFGRTPGGDPYIVMELLTGEDLAHTLARRGAIEPLRAVRTLMPIFDALAAAHAKKIIHRDLKPDNIFLAQTEDGRTQPKLVDFGIAKLEREDSQRITQLGATMGSPAYMSPEQARGLDVDLRTDVWSMCVVLYEVLTKSLPFNGQTYTALLCSILEQPPKPITELGVQDLELWQIIARGLHKDPEQRWSGMRELGAALANWALARGANDDVTGRSLVSTWIERPPDSLPAGSPAFTSSQPEVAAAGSIPDLGRSATQLDATVSGATRRRGLSLAGWLGAGAGALILVIGVGVVVRMASGSAEGSTPAPATSAMLAEAPPSSGARPVEVALVVPSSGPAPSSAPQPSAAPAPSTKPKPAAATPFTRPTAKPSGKPAEASAPTSKPPSDIKLKLD